jgi:raffinose/stachyose/melibiose transport system substrate-binding protein
MGNAVRRFRSIFAVAAVLAASLSLSGCDLFEKLFGAKKIPLTVVTTEPADLFAAFQEAHPEIELTVTTLGDGGYSDLVNALAAGTGEMPAVMEIKPVAYFLSGTPKRLKDMASRFAADQGKFVLKLDGPLAGGYLSFLPYSATVCGVIFADTRAFNAHSPALALPNTYANFQDLVPVLAADGKGTMAMALGQGENWELQSTLFSLVLTRLLGPGIAIRLREGQASFTDQGVVDALARVRAMVTDNVIDPASFSTLYDDLPPRLVNGQAATMLDGLWRSAYFKGAEHDWLAIRPFPALPGESAPGTVALYTNSGYGIDIGIEADSDLETAALDLVGYMASAAVQRERLVSADTPPSRKDISADGLPHATAKMLALYAGLPSDNGYALDSVLPDQVYNVINVQVRKAAVGEITPLQAAQAMQDVVAAWRASH